MKDLTQKAQRDLNRMTQILADKLRDKFGLTDSAITAVIRLFLKAAYLQGRADQAVEGLAKDVEQKAAAQSPQK